MQGQRAEVWDNNNVLAIVVGGSSEDLRYLKSISLHLWLFGYEVTGEPVYVRLCVYVCVCLYMSVCVHVCVLVVCWR